MAHRHVNPAFFSMSGIIPALFTSCMLDSGVPKRAGLFAAAHSGSAALYVTTSITCKRHHPQGALEVLQFMFRLCCLPC